MRALYLALGIALTALTTGQAAQVDKADNAAVYVVAYVEVVPPSTREAVALLGQYRSASRKDEGNLRLETLQQTGRADHFAVVEVWRDQKSFEAHQAASHTKQFREKLQGLQASPYDERVHRGLVVGAAPGAPAPGATYVLTHADAIPTGKDAAIGLLKPLAEASWKENGNARFEVLQQNSRQNHFTIVEVWKDQKAIEAHAMSVHTKQFRHSFQPMSGALYDERLYRAVGEP